MAESRAEADGQASSGSRQGNAEPSEEIEAAETYNVTKLEEEIRSLRKQLKGTKGGGAGISAAVAANEATRQSKEKLLEWSLATVEDLAHQVSTMGPAAGKVNAV